MLEELEIRGLGPIGHAVVELPAGMTAITGETGAGKSMLLNALRLISGGTAPARLVGPGCDGAWAQGIFSVASDGEAARIAADAGSGVQDGELFLSRVLPAQGRSRAVLNGRTVPRAVLQDLGGELVTVHGQADQLRMAAPARQREFLDAYAGNDGLLQAYRSDWKRLNECDERLRGVLSQESEATQRADYLRESIERIDRVAPHAGEDDELKALRDRIENAAEIVRGVSGALAALDPSQVDADADSSGAVPLIGQAVQSLRSIHVDGPFSDAADRLESLNAELADVVFTLADQLDDEGQTRDLDDINGRIHELDGLTRRWGPTLDDVIAWRERAGYELEDLDDSPERVERLRREWDEAYHAASASADRLSEARRAAAAELGGRVTDELSSLAMNGAALDIEVVARPDPGKDRIPQEGFGPLDAYGRDDVAFLFTPFPGSPRLPMGKSASGGELSRLMLALELSAAESSGRGTAAATFVFDEVDAGVGGKAAVELGRRLARLARSAQVIVVTHLAQVASWADAQYVVSKGAGPGDAVTTTVTRVSGAEREQEIARMLDGGATEAALVHARQLLETSRL